MSSYDELVERTVNKSCKFSSALGSTLLHAVVGRYCGKLIQTGEPFFEGGISYVMPKGSPLTPMLSNATLKLKVEGALPSVLEYLGRNDKCILRNDPTLSFSRLRIFFFVAFGVCFLVFLEMVIDPQTVHKDTDTSKADVKSTGAESTVVCSGQEMSAESASSDSFKENVQSV